MRNASITPASRIHEGIFREGTNEYGRSVPKI